MMKTIRECKKVRPDWLAAVPFRGPLGEVH